MRKIFFIFPAILLFAVLAYGLNCPISADYISIMGLFGVIGTPIALIGWAIYEICRTYKKRTKMSPEQRKAEQELEQRKKEEELDRRYPHTRIKEAKILRRGTGYIQSSAWRGTVGLLAGGIPGWLTALLISGRVGDGGVVTFAVRYADGHVAIKKAYPNSEKYRKYMKYVKDKEPSLEQMLEEQWESI